MKLNNGLWRDGDPIDQPDNTYRNALNISITDKPGAIGTEKGMTKLLQNRGSFLGSIDTPTMGTVLFFRRDTIDKVLPAASSVEGCEIGWLRPDGSYRILLEGKEVVLGSYVQGVGATNHKGELIVVWTDGETEPKMLNVSLQTAPQVVTAESWKNFNLFPPAVAPRLKAVQPKATGGSLTPGSYSLFVAYESKSGWVSPAFGPYGLFHVGGGTDGTASSEAIALGLEGLDTRYPYIRLYAMKDELGAKTAYFIDSYPISTTQFVWTGGYRDTVDPAELLLPHPGYKTAKAIALYLDRLHLANLTSDTEVDMQPYANGVKVKWVADERYEQEEGNGITRSFMPGATYALYVRYRRANGTVTGYYHIPGRYANEAYFARFQNDVLVNEGVRPADVVDNALVDGTMGLQRNETERYPDEDRWLIREGDRVTGSLKNDYVRHHKMPYPKRMAEQVLSPAMWNPRNLGIQFMHPPLPDNLASGFIGAEYAFATRDISDMDVVSYVPILTNSFAQFAFTSSTSLPSSKRLSEPVRIYDFTLLTKKPRLSNTYFQTEYVSLNFASVGYNSTNPEQPGYSTLSAKPVQYVPANNSILFNEEREEALLVQSENTVYGGNWGGDLRWGMVDNNGTQDYAVGNGVPISSLKQYLPTMYRGFENRSVSELPGLCPINGEYSLPSFAGDMTVSRQTVRFMRRSTQTAQGEYLYFSDNLTTYKTTGQLSYTTWSRLPYSRRREDLSLKPKLDKTIKKYAGEYLNQFLLDAHYELTNTLGGQRSSSTERASSFPTRIVRSLPLQNEALEAAWQSIRPLDYYECERDLGAIVKLCPVGNELLIHHQKGAYLTSGNERLQTGSRDVFIGSGDIFAQPPRLITSRDGQGGLFHHSHALLTTAGYIWVDRQTGKVYLFNGTLTEISAAGLRTFFLKALSGRLYEQWNRQGIYYEGAYRAGVTFGEDTQGGRILLTIRDFELVDDTLWGDPNDLL